MKKHMLIGAAALAAARLCAAPTPEDAARPEPWADTSVNSINRLPAAAFLPPLADEKAALSDALVPETPYVKSLNIDARQTGLGGASCGPGPMWKYRFDSSKPVSWTYRLESVAR